MGCLGERNSTKYFITNKYNQNGLCTQRTSDNLHKWEKNEILHDIWGREMIKWYGFPVGSIFEKKKNILSMWMK